MKRHLTIILMAFVLFMFHTNSMSEDLFMFHTNSMSEDLPAACMAASVECGIAQGNLTLRDSPPSWPFYRKGKAIGVIKKDSYLIVEEQKDTIMLFDKYEWLRVKPVKGNQSGWLYNGKIAKDGDDLPYVLLWKSPPS